MKILGNLRISGYIMILMLLFVLPLTVEAKECEYWFAVVGVKDALIPETFVDEKDSGKVMEGIECLLKLEGDKSRGAFGGAAHTQVSAMLPMTTVDVCALYYVSKLFYQNYEHANGVVLVDSQNRWNRQRSVSQAYRSYRKWFIKVKKVGLDEARKQKLDPLQGSGVSWY